VPHCTKAFAKAVIDPFSDVENVCLPCTLLPLPSRKYVTRATVQWSTGTANIGLLLVAPQISWTSGTPSIWYSGATYAGTSASVVDSAAIGMTATAVVSPTSAALTAGTLVRLATFGTKTSVTTPGMNRGGTLFSDQSAERYSLTSTSLSRQIGQCFSDTAACRMPFGTGQQQMHTTGIGPSLPAHIDFTVSNDPNLNAPYFMIGCSSTAAQSMLTEFIFYWEVIDVLNPSGLTPSHAEPSFAGAVVASVNSVIAANPGGDHHRSPNFLQRFGKLLGDGWKAVSPVVKAVAPSLVRGALSFVPGVGPALSAIAGAAGPMAMRAIGGAIRSRQQNQARIAPRRR